MGHVRYSIYLQKHSPSHFEKLSEEGEETSMTEYIDHHVICRQVEKEMQSKIVDLESKLAAQSEASELVKDAIPELIWAFSSVHGVAYDDIDCGYASCKFCSAKKDAQEALKSIAECAEK
jgi:hypothetical protein